MDNIKSEFNNLTECLDIRIQRKNKKLVQTEK